MLSISMFPVAAVAPDCKGLQYHTGVYVAKPMGLDALMNVLCWNIQFIPHPSKAKDWGALEKSVEFEVTTLSWNDDVPSSVNAPYRPTAWKLALFVLVVTVLL